MAAPTSMEGLVVQTLSRAFSSVRSLEGKTRSPAIAEGPRDAGVPVEMSMSIVDL